MDRLEIPARMMRGVFGIILALSGYLVLLNLSGGFSWWILIVAFWPFLLSMTWLEVTEIRRVRTASVGPSEVEGVDHGAEVDPEDDQPTDQGENPSLEMSYLYIKGALESQARMWDGLDNKASTLWILGTAIIGVGLPVILSGSSQNPISFLPILISALAFYGLSTVLAVLSYIPRRIRLMNDPRLIREDYWELEQKQFPWELSLHIESAFETNERTLNFKGYTVIALFAAVLFESGLFVSWAILSSLS